MHENNTTTTRLPGAAYDDDSAAPGDAVVSKNTNARNWPGSNDLRPIVLVVE